MRFSVPALVLVVGVAAPLAASASPIANPSFEIYGDAFDELDGWTSGGSGPFSVDHSTFAVNGLPTDGTATGFKAGGGGLAAGEYGSASQVVDLTGIDTITFDASLDQFASGTEQDDWTPVLEAGFVANGVYLWTAYDDGSYIDQTADVSFLTGAHTIEFRLRAVTGTGAYAASDWLQFDNLRVTEAVPEPSTALLLATTLAGLAAARRSGRSAS